MALLPLIMAALRTRLGRFAALGLVAAAALWLYGAHVRREARLEALARLQAATQAESERRLAVIDAARKNAERQADALAGERARVETLLLEIAHVSAAHDRDACLVDGSVRRLNRVGQPPGGGTRRGRPAG